MTFNPALIPAFATTTALLAAYAAGEAVPPTVQTGGRTTAFDGGGCIFSYNAADTTTVDNGGTIRVDAASRRWYAAPYLAISAALFGAKGDGSTDDTAALQKWLNVGLGPVSSPHGSNYYANLPLYLPPGHFIITSALQIKSAIGAWIYGAGRFTTTIENTSNTGCFVTNGFQYSKVERMQLKSNGTTEVLFDLDWDGSAAGGLQSNTFADMYFQSGGTGIRIGDGGHQGSEMLFLNCFWDGCDVAGLSTQNFNALQQSVVGGNFQDCGIGIYVFKGSVPVIQGVGFQGSTDFDIRIDNTAKDSYSIAGCRTESLNFLNDRNGSWISVNGCTQVNASAGWFANVTRGIVLSGCQSQAGYLSTSNGGVLVRQGCSFQTGVYLGDGGSIHANFGPTVDLDTKSNQTYSTTINHDTGTTLTSVGIYGGVIQRTGSPMAGFTDTTDTAQNIIDAFPAASPKIFLSNNVGNSFSVKVQNQTGQDQTINGGTGVTMVGPNVIVAGESRTFLAAITDADTPTVSFYG